MCGITGIFDTRGKRDINRAVLHRMNEAQFHRGPDEGGLHLEPGVGLGHRRLSIIDLSTGQQPLYNEDKTVCVVFNGEIYNYQALIPELQALGHTFHTRSDTEVIVHAWESWGEKCVERFRGMFAFALWDSNRETLFLARDRLGVKPLYYALLDDGTFLFGSELKSILAHGGLKREIDPCAVEEYFALGYIAEPRSIFKQAKKLSPAHTLLLQRGQAMGEPREYWDINFTLDNPINDTDACTELSHRLEESIKLRMISEVPLGAFLSGGVDSSAVVAMMAGLSECCGQHLFHRLFDDPAFNESEFAKMVADRYHTNHHLEMVESDDFDLIDTLAKLYDEPYADSSAIPTYRVCQLARKHVTVALSGDGGDESFGGYRRYKLHLMEEKMRSALPLSLRRPVFGALGKLYPKADWAPRVFRAKTTFEGIARNSVEAYFHSVSILRAPMRNQLFSPAFKSALGGYDAIQVFNQHAAKAKTVGRPAGPDSIPRPQNLSGRRHQHQGRPRQHGPFAGSSRTTDGSRADRMARHAQVLTKNSRPGNQIPAQKIDGAVPPQRRALSPEDGFLRPACPLVPRPAQTARSGCAARPPSCRNRLVQSRISAASGRRSQQRQRDYSASLWTMLMFEAFLRNVMETGEP
jgi:asparagine synthase (glutamine-hydrolysing)